MCEYLVTMIIAMFKKNHIPKLRTMLFLRNGELVELI